MVRTAVLKVDDHTVEGVSTNKAKGEKMVLDPPMNSAQRRTLGDITNLPNQKTMLNLGANQQQQSLSLSSKEYAEKLQKENMRLMKTLKERNAIIERTGSELQKYRTNFTDGSSTELAAFPDQHPYLGGDQNKQRPTGICCVFQLKALQHELSCKNGVLMARKLPLEPQKLPCTQHDAAEDKDRADASGEACETFHPKGEDHKIASESSDVNSLQINEKKSGVSGKSSLANSKVLDIVGRPGESAQTTNIRRVSLRRQSRRFNIQDLGVTENLSGIHDDQEFAAKAGCSASDLSIGSKPEAVELDDTKEINGKSRRVSSRRQSTEAKSQRGIKISTDLPPSHDDIVEESSSQVSSSVSMEVESQNKPRGDEAEEMRETYVGRPLRQAAGKIKSYKEVSLKEKMRRDF